jgi:hypothetical protein
MFVVTEAEAAAIRAVYQQRGEFAAAVELRRRFPGIADNAQAREVRPHHRQLEAAAAAAGEANAEAVATTPGALRLAWSRGSRNLSRLKKLAGWSRFLPIVAQTLPAASSSEAPCFLRSAGHSRVIRGGVPALTQSGQRGSWLSVGAAKK